MKAMSEYIVDFHCDTLLNLKDKVYNFNVDNKKYHIDLPKLRKAGVNVQVFAVFVEPEYNPLLSLERALQIIDDFYDLIESCKDLELAKNYSDIENIVENGKIAALLSQEGAYCIFDLSALRTLYRLGVRIVTLTHNQRNLIADGVGEEDANGGITKFGRNVIEEMNRLGMVIDVTHLSESGFWDVLKYSKDPVIASHSNVKRVCNHRHNLSDAQIVELAKKEGMIGINFYPSFLSERGEADLKSVAKHIMYIKNIVGISHVGLGCDFDGISKTPKNLKNIGDLPNLFAFLKRENILQEEELEKFKGGNWLRLIRKILKK